MPAGPDPLRGLFPDLIEAAAVAQRPGGLSSPSNATLAANPTATGTITDNDRVGMGGVCNRTTRVRDRIIALLKNRHSYKGDCSGVNETHLAKLQSLDLGRNPSTESAFTLSLQSDDFKGLVNLERLYMRETGCARCWPGCSLTCSI